VKCSEVLQCSDGLSKKVSNIIGRQTDNMKLLLVCILLLSFYIYVFLFNTVVYVFLLLCLLLYVYVSSSCQLALFGYPDLGFPVLFPQL